ncbi:hypothetical protein CYMTET_53266 [Cymbomonas tetramitiformis]|uniref:Uncharacterized protein n=1 Tax=Cymbomonas tetramitiformis TaxID=36881 RepID=A0AAE0EQS1_9CHLO|nr:hypothetical protein CYMTET_53266 [Cymbomonas tetramitiformis]
MFFEKLSSYSINVDESDEVKENGAENDGQREYQKLNGRFDYVPMEKFLRHHREILGPVQMDEETLERWCRLLNAIYQKNKLVQKRNMTDEEKIDCARWATRALIACHEVWYEADVIVYMELQRSQFDENPSAKLQEYWMDGHYNGAPTTDPMFRAWTPAEVKGELIERTQRERNDMHTANGGGQKQKSEDRDPHDLQPEGRKIDVGELEAKLEWGMIQGH